MGCLLLFTVRRWVEICLVGDIVVNTIKLFIVNVELFTVLADPSDLTLQKEKIPVMIHPILFIYFSYGHGFYLTHKAYRRDTKNRA